MTVVIVRHLYCDHEGCLRSYGLHDPPTGENVLLSVVRVAARRAGWTFRQARDFCPQHSIGPGVTGGLSLRMQCAGHTSMYTDHAQCAVNATVRGQNGKFYCKRHYKQGSP